MSAAALAAIPASEVQASSPLRLIDEYLHSLDVRPATRESYAKGLRVFVDWLNQAGVTEPTRATILEYKAYLVATYAASTVSRLMTAVRCFFTYLFVEYHTPDICRGVHGSRQPRNHRRGALKLDQAKTLVHSLGGETLEELRNAALINLLLCTGLRTIEAVRADVGDIDNVAGQAVLNIRGKGHDEKDDFVLLPDEVLALINRYLNARGRTLDSAPLFASVSDRNNGGRLTPQSISRIVKTALRGIGIDSRKITTHSLRHTAVTMALASGKTLQEVQAMARHASPATTLIYAHNIDRIKVAAEKSVASMLYN